MFRGPTFSVLECWNLISIEIKSRQAGRERLSSCKRADRHKNQPNINYKLAKKYPPKKATGEKKRKKERRYRHCQTQITLSTFSNSGKLSTTIRVSSTLSCFRVSGGLVLCVIPSFSLPSPASFSFSLKHRASGEGPAFSLPFYPPTHYDNEPHNACKK